MRKIYDLDDPYMRTTSKAQQTYATPAFYDFTNADVQDHLHYLFNGTHGYVFLATLDRSEVKPVPRDVSFAWPDQREDIIAWIVEAMQKPWTEVFICPYPMKTRTINEGDRTRSGRKAGASSSRRIIHADVDVPLSNATSAFLRRWGFRMVASGTPGHVQVYARLTRSLTVAEHRGMAAALRTFVSGDDKISDNDYLKLPGSWNYKNHPRVDEHKRNDRKYPVTVVWNGRVNVDADRLMDALKAKPIEQETAVEPTPQWTPVKVVAGKLPPHLQAYVYMTADEATDRSSTCHAAVLAFADAGHTRDQIHTALDTFAPGVDKWGTDKWHNEIDRILGKRRPVADIGEGFWDRTPELQHIYDVGFANLAGPWATLGVVMANALVGVPPNVHLPAAVGPGGVGIRSLNLFVLLAGGSSQGKGTATRAGFHAIRFGHRAHASNIGSGQGIGKIFKRAPRKDERVDSDGMVWERKAAYLDIPEVAVLTSAIGSKDNSLAPELCKAWAGEILGTQTNTADRNVTIMPDTYRLCAIVGGQPSACGPLFAKVTIGLPQRFLYLPTDGEQLAEEPVPIPDPMIVDIPQPDLDDDGVYVLKFPATVGREIWQRQAGVHNKTLTIPELEKHAQLVRIKVMVALAVIHGRLDPTETDWELAGIVMAKSASTIHAIQAALRVASTDEVKADGKRDGLRKAVAEETRAAYAEGRIKTKVLSVLKREHDKGHEWVGNLASKMPRFDVNDIRSAVEQLVSSKSIRRRRAGTGFQYQIAREQ